MKQVLKKSCVTLELRIGFLIVCIVSIVIFGGLGAAFPTVVDLLVRQAFTSPAMMDLLKPLLIMIDDLNIIMRVFGCLLFLASCGLLVSWFLMNKYSGSGQDAGMFSCFAAANPMNIKKRKNLKYLMLPWLAAEAAFFLALVYLTIDVIVKGANYNVGAAGIIVPLIVVIIIGLIQAYCMIVVVSYYIEQTNASM